MDILRIIIEAGRNHYEKLLLSLALVGLGLAVYYLDQASQKEENKIQDFLGQVEQRSKRGTFKLDELGSYDSVLSLVKQPPSLNFGLPHNLFNPVKWQRRPNNDLLKVQTGSEVGWPQMEIARVTPLNFTVAFEKAVGANGYFVALTRDVAPSNAPIKQVRVKRRLYIAMNVTNTFSLDLHFVLRDIKGAPENPEELVLELVESNERISVTKDKPFVKTEGYEADLKYKVDGQTFPNLRQGSKLHFLSDDYIIVAISPTEVVASATLNEKKYSVRQAAAGP